VRSTRRAGSGLSAHVRRGLAMLAVGATVATAIVAGGVASAQMLPGNGRDAAIGGATSPVTGSKFDVSTLPTAASVNAGGSTSTIVIPYFESPPSAPVKLSLSGAPIGVVASFSPPEVSIELSTLTLDVSESTCPGTYELLITATAPNEVDEASFMLTVTT
jgi:hypothetical protein